MWSNSALRLKFTSYLTVRAEPEADAAAAAAGDSGIKADGLRLDYITSAVIISTREAAGLKCVIHAD